MANYYQLKTKLKPHSQDNQTSYPPDHQPSEDCSCQLNQSDHLEQLSQPMEWQDMDMDMDMYMDNRGLAYADGFFTTMGVYQGSILWEYYHHQRLLSHSQALHLTLDTPLIMRQVTLLAKHINEGVIKLIITRQSQPVLGYGFSNGDTKVYAKTMPMSMPAYHSLPTEHHSEHNSTHQSRAYTDIHSILIKHHIPIQPISEAICLTAQIACLPKPLVGLKSLNRLDSVLVAGELERAKAINPNIIEGLVADVSHTFDDIDGYLGDKDAGKKPASRSWVEGVMSNVCYRLGTDTRWYTPPISHSGVNGVMRHLLMDKFASEGQPLVERRLVDNDLSHSDNPLSAMFFCNAVRGIIPIRRLHLLDGGCLSMP